MRGQDLAMGGVRFVSDPDSLLGDGHGLRELAQIDERKGHIAA